MAKRRNLCSGICLYMLWYTAVKSDGEPTVNRQSRLTSKEGHRRNMSLNIIIEKAKRFIQRMKRRFVNAWLLLIEKRHYYTSLQSYVFEYPEMAEILSIRTSRLVYAMGKEEDNIEYAGQLILKKARIKNATCFVFSDIIKLNDGRCLYEMKELELLQPYVNFKDEIILHDTAKWCKLKRCRESIYIPRAIKIGGMFGFNYFHFMYQILPRMLETSDIDPSVPLLLYYSVRDISSLHDLVIWCNQEKRDVIYMEYDIAYNIGELYIISSPSFIIPNLKTSLPPHIISCSYSDDSIRQLSKRLIHYADAKMNVAKRIFICRNKAGRRRQYNEQELFDTVSPYGFKSIFPEELSMAEQISAFYNADIIVAPSGAALTNLLFIKPGALVIIFYNLPPTRETLWESIIKILGGRVITLYDTKGTNRLKYQRNFYINPITLKETIKHLEITENNEK